MDDETASDRLQQLKAMLDQERNYSKQVMEYMAKRCFDCQQAAAGPIRMAQQRTHSCLVAENLPYMRLERQLHWLERKLDEVWAENKRLREALETARSHIIRHHDVGKQVKLGQECPVCVREDGSEPELCQIAEALERSKR